MELIKESCPPRFVQDGRKGFLRCTNMPIKQSNYQSVSPMEMLNQFHSCRKKLPAVMPTMNLMESLILARDERGMCRIRCHLIRKFRLVELKPKGIISCKLGRKGFSPISSYAGGPTYYY